MKTSLLVLATLVSVIGFSTLASSAGATSVMTDADSADIVSTSCGTAAALAGPLNLDLIPSKPVVGHQSVQGVGDDDDGCAGEAEHEGNESGEGEGGSDD